MYPKIILCIIHALYNKNPAFPFLTQNKKCHCDLNLIKNYKHEDNGNLIEGILSGNEVIICDKCYCIFDYNYFKWCCPKCGEYFQTQNNTIFSVRNHNNNKEIYLTNRYSFIEGSRYSKSPRSKNINKNLYHNNGVFEMISSNNLSPINKEDLRMLKTASFIEGNKNIDLSKNNNRSSLKDNNYNRSMKKFKERSIPRNINIKISNYYSCINSNEKSNSKKKNKIGITNTEVERTRSKIINRRKISPSPKKNLNSGTRNKIKIISENINRINKKSENKRNSNYNNKNDKKSKKFEKCVKRKNTNTKSNNNDNNNNNNTINSVNSLTQGIKSSNKQKLIQHDSNTITTNDEKHNRIFKNNKNNKNNKNKDENNENYLDKKIYERITKKNYRRTNYNSLNSTNPFIYVKTNNNNNNSSTALNASSNKKNYDKKNPKKIISNNFIQIQASLNIKPTCINSYNKKYISEKNKNSISKNIMNESNTMNDEIIINSDEYQTANDIKENITQENYYKIQQKFNSENYNILNLLGEGTFGKTYLVEEQKSKKKYGLKKIIVGDMDELNEHKLEYELIMKLLKNEPNLNIINIYGIEIKTLDKYNIAMYILMDAAISDWEQELKGRSYNKKYYTENELMKILSNLVDTFMKLQQKGICHRDVKPQNILFFGKRKI